MRPLRRLRNTRGAAGRVNLFAWTILLLLLTGFAIASWIGSFQIFGHPEQALSYRVLTAVKKISPPRRFELTRAPNGDFVTARAFYDRHVQLPATKLVEVGESLQRSYIRNYAQQKDRIPYLIGRFVILDARPLGDADYFPDGVVALARSMDQPGLLIEYVCTAGPDALPVLQETLQPGLELKFERSIDLCAVVSVTRPAEGRLLATVVPLLYGSYSRPDGEGHFSLDPPGYLRPAGGLPLTSLDRINEGETRHAEWERTRTPTATARALARVMRAAPATTPDEPDTAGRPKIAAATPRGERPAAPPKPAPVKAPTAAIATPVPPPPARPATPVPAPAVVPTPASATETAPASKPAPPPPTATAIPSGAVELKPFLADGAAPAASPIPPAPSPAVAAPSGWRTYPAGAMPRGRLVAPREAAGLRKRGVEGERLYLEGTFAVARSGGNRVVLTPKRSVVGRVPGLNRVLGESVRVEVEFPPGRSLPVEGGNVERDASRPFQILSVEEDPRGGVVIRAREVTDP